MWQRPTQRCKAVSLQLKTKKDDSLDMLSKPQRMPPSLGGQGRTQGLELRPCGQALTALGSGPEGNRVQAQADDTYREWLDHLSLHFPHLQHSDFSESPGKSHTGKRFHFSISFAPPY